MKPGNVLLAAVFSVALLSVGAPRMIAQGGVNMAEWGLRRSATVSPAPEYPKQSLAQKVEGVVVAAVLFGVDGKLASLDILQSPDEHTATAVRDAVGRWTVPGVEVRGREERSPLRGKLTFYFQVRDGKGLVLDPDQMPGGPARPKPRPAPAGPSGAPSAPIASPRPAPAAVRGGHGEDLQTITVAAFKKEAGRPHVVLDIGQRGAFRRGHWPGAVNIPLDELSVRGGIELPRDRQIVIDCTQEDTQQCRFAGGYLNERGITNVLLLLR